MNVYNVIPMVIEQGSRGERGAGTSVVTVNGAEVAALDGAQQTVGLGDHGRAGFPATDRTR